jgi:hypothetical protein
MNKLNSLQRALEQGKLNTRPLREIERDQEETILWADAVAKEFPVKVRRGRPPKSGQSNPSRSVTVRFPAAEAQIIMSSAMDQGLTLSEFVRAAAFKAATPKTIKGREQRPIPPKPIIKKPPPATKLATKS